MTGLYINITTTHNLITPVKIMFMSDDQFTRMTQNQDKMIENPKKIDMSDISFSNLIFFNPAIQLGCCS